MFLVKQSKMVAKLRLLEGQQLVQCLEVRHLGRHDVLHAPGHSPPPEVRIGAELHDERAIGRERSRLPFSGAHRTVRSWW